MLAIVRICLLPAPVPPRAPDSSDDYGDRTWTSDDQRDFEDQQSPPPSPMQHYPATQDPLVSRVSLGPSSVVPLQERSVSE